MQIGLGFLYYVKNNGRLICLFGFNFPSTCSIHIYHYQLMGLCRLCLFLRLTQRTQWFPSENVTVKNLVLLTIFSRFSNLKQREVDGWQDFLGSHLDEFE